MKVNTLEYRKPFHTLILAESIVKKYQSQQYTDSVTSPQNSKYILHRNIILNLKIHI